VREAIRKIEASGDAPELRSVLKAE
jgi:hypothetical protein